MKSALKHINLLLLDVDGVLTDGKITYTDKGDEIKNFNSQDGFGLRMLMDHQVRVGIITGRASMALLHRCKNLGIDLILDGQKNKASALQSILDQTRIPAHETAFIGDDLLDLPAMTRVGFAIAVNNAVEEVKAAADMVTLKNGGQGAVREACEAILKAKGLWKQIIDSYTQ